MSEDWEDTELIECSRCGQCLNGKSLWIVGEVDPETVCDDCYNNNKKEPRE